MGSVRPPRNNYILVVFDSCRYDSFVKARPPVIKKLGKVERRWSYASWTAPSHFNLLTGLMPHRSPKHVFASEYYKHEFLKFNERLGSSGIEFRSLVPKLYLPPFLSKLGYRTHAMVSLPVINPRTILNSGFDSYKLMPKHNDMRAMLGEIRFTEGQPSFYLLNVGETHYPYALPDEPPEEWPRISGVHGVFQHLDHEMVGGRLVAKRPKFFNSRQMERLRQRQVDAVRRLDRVVEELFDLVAAKCRVKPSDCCDRESRGFAKAFCSSIFSVSIRMLTCCGEVTTKSCWKPTNLWTKRSAG